MADTMINDPNKPAKFDFPHSIVLKASAGSGKTHALTLRFVEFLLSDSIKKNSLRNILAITFSNNAAAEMRERILEWLKALSLGREEQTKQFTEAVDMPVDNIAGRASAMISLILEQYADLQVKTIDSFMTGIFKASAIDLGYTPDFEVVLQNNALIEYAFDIFLRNVKEQTEAAGFLEEMIRRIIESKDQKSSFPWDPSAMILDELKNIYRKAASTWKTVIPRELSSRIKEAKQGIRTAADELDSLIESSGLERSKGSSFLKILDLVRNDRFPDLIHAGMRNPPVKVVKTKDEQKKADYRRIAERWEELVVSIGEYVGMYAEAYYFPYLKVFQAVKETIERVKKREERIFIEDINHTLAGFMDREAVPDIYFRIGETIYHYLIDEFQDTSPVQWKNLRPLVEESLSKYGSLLVVGDTKQAIYGFRDADYRIMRDMERPDAAPFPSAEHLVKELKTNQRSLQRIIDVNAEVFRQTVAKDEKYGSVAQLSGLTDYVQQVKPGNENKGVVQVMKITDADDQPERPALQEMMKRLQDRGYGFRDIAILTFENDDVVNITGWLNELAIPFISHSSLDIRRRRIIAEIVSLLRFLDSPLDDLSFSTILLGDIFASAIRLAGPGPEQMQEFIFRNRKSRPLYKSFQAEYPELWGRWFEKLFRSTGYLPLYDLVTEIYRTFDLFPCFRMEEAALARMLEVVKTYEQSGKNSLRDFIAFADDEETGEAEWNIDLPKDTDAVQVMTIHKAKGLGFPVVILVAYGRTSRGFSHVMKEIAGSEEITFTRLSREIAKIVPELAELYSGLEQKEMVNNLNSLYVALTRAEAELYVLCVQQEKSKEGFHGCRFLSSEAYPSGPMPEKIYPGRGLRSEKVQLEHGALRPLPVAGSQQSMNLAERERGNYIHAVLSSIEFYDQGDHGLIRDAIAKVNSGMEAAYPEDDIFNLVSSFLASPSGELFGKKEGRTIKREMEIVDSSGNLYRIDRLVIDQDMLTVMEFKTGIERSQEPAHISQVKQYTQILKAIYTDVQIRGMVAYVELMQSREVM